MIEKFSNPEDSQEFKINPETGMIVSHGHEYLNIPRMRDFIKRANKIRDSLPPMSENMTRLWRGNRPGEVGQNPSFTSALEGIALPFLGSYGGKLSYVDIPNQDLKKYLCEGAVAPDSEYILPLDLASKATIVEEK